MSDGVKSAADRRRELLDNARRLGIDDDYVSELVDTFYDRIQVHSVLGPVFEAKLGAGDWGPHLATMKDFWASVAYNAGRYSGQPVPKHMAVEGIEREHFSLWLALFEETLRDTAPSPAVVPYFMARANRIAESLKLAIFGLPGLPGHRA